MKAKLPVIFLLLAAAALSGCRREKAPVEMKASLQPMPPYSPQEDAGQLEDMPDDGQGTVYF